MGLALPEIWSGSTAKDWAMVQPGVSGFSRVCSYDHASHGESDKAPAALQSVDEVVDDLHGWLKASGEKRPFILVSHSISGLYARRFVTRFPSEAAGLVFVDSSHEEQLSLRTAKWRAGKNISKLSDRVVNSRRGRSSQAKARHAPSAILNRQQLRITCIMN
jgi:pimeloyl-ACP methyl ester carboxylesterase